MAAEFLRKRPHRLAAAKEEICGARKLNKKKAIEIVCDKLRTYCFFASDKIVRSNASNASIRDGGQVYAISSGILRQATVDDSGNKVGPITEYIATYELVVRWKKTTSKNPKAKVESKK